MPGDDERFQVLANSGLRNSDDERRRKQRNEVI